MDNQILIIGLYTLAILAAVLMFKPNKSDNTEAPSAPSNSYENLMQILTETVQREIQHHHTMKYKVQDVKVIYDFQSDLTSLVKDVMGSFSSSFLKEVEYYHSREYMIRFVTRFVEAYLIEYTKQNKIKTK